MDRRSFLLALGAAVFGAPACVTNAAAAQYRLRLVGGDALARAFGDLAERTERLRDAVNAVTAEQFHRQLPPA